jgi:hypothetical protein
MAAEQGAWAGQGWGRAPLAPRRPNASLFAPCPKWSPHAKPFAAQAAHRAGHGCCKAQNRGCWCAEVPQCPPHSVHDRKQAPSPLQQRCSMNHPQSQQGAWHVVTHMPCTSVTGRSSLVKTRTRREMVSFFSSRLLAAHSPDRSAASLFSELPTSRSNDFTAMLGDDEKAAAVRKAVAVGIGGRGLSLRRGSGKQGGRLPGCHGQGPGFPGSRNGVLNFFHRAFKVSYETWHPGRLKTACSQSLPAQPSLLALPVRPRPPGRPSPPANSPAAPC